MSYKINDTVVVDDSRNVCACCVTSCCITASDQMVIPSGTTACRPTGATGSLYFDTDEGALVAYDGTEWAKQGGGGMPTSDTVGTCRTYIYAGGLKELNCRCPIMPFNNALSDRISTNCSGCYCTMVVPRATGMIQHLVDSDDASGCCWICFNKDNYISPDLNFISIAGKNNCCHSQYLFGTEKWFFMKTCPMNCAAQVACIGTHIIAAHECCCHFSIYCASNGSRYFCGTLGSNDRIFRLYETGDNNLGIITYCGKFIEISLTCYTCVLSSKFSPDISNFTLLAQGELPIAQTTNHVGITYQCCTSGPTQALVYDKATKCFYHYCPSIYNGCTPQYVHAMNINDTIYFKSYVHNFATGCSATRLSRVNSDLSCIYKGITVSGKCCAWMCEDSEKLWPRHNAETVSFNFHHKCYGKGTYQALATVDPILGGFESSGLTSSPSGYCIYVYTHSCSCPSFCSGAGTDCSTCVCSGCSGGCLLSNMQVYNYVE